MAEIFISFIHEEQKVAEAVQRLLQRHLETRGVFLSSDQWQVFAGEIWLDRIREELSSAKVVVLLLSRQSVERPWVNFEAGGAWLSRKPIMPVCYGGLTKSALPKPYSGIQALDLRADWYYLLSSVARHMQRSLAPVPFRREDDEACRRLWEALHEAEGSPGEKAEEEVTCPFRSPSSHGWRSTAKPSRHAWRRGWSCPLWS